jgi:hypothetical protein
MKKRFSYYTESFLILIRTKETMILFIKNEQNKNLNEIIYKNAIVL